VNIEIVQGKSKSWDITVEDDNGLVNLNGKSLVFDAKYSFKDPDPPVITKSLTAKNQGTDLGEATLALAPSNTSTITPVRTSVLYFQITLVDGTEKYIVEAGKLTVRPAVDQ